MSGSYNQGSYNEWFLQPKVLTTRDLTTRRSYSQGSYNQRFLQPGVLQPEVLTARGLTTRSLSDQWIKKFWPLRYLFATFLVMYTMIVRWRNSLSALLLLKWITKSCWNFGESVSECKHICHCDRFIFCILLWVHHNSMLLTLRKKFICSTVLHTVFALFASLLTAALPFSMRTSSLLSRLVIFFFKLVKTLVSIESLSNFFCLEAW